MTLDVNMFPNVYSIPGPRALEVTRLTPEDLSSPDRISEFKAAFEISTMLSDIAMDGKRVYTGYNTLSFDEPLMRYFFFRNLLNPYRTTGKNVRRLDLFPVFQYLHFVRPGIVLPGMDAQGNVSWRLSYVMEANGFKAEGAHSAVEDTIFVLDLLTQKFIKGAPDLVVQMVELSDRMAVNKLIKRNYGGGDFLLLFTHFGMPEVHPVAPVTSIDSNGYKTLCVDLSVPIREWESLSPEEIAAKSRQPGSPFRIIKANTCPMLFDRKDETLSAALRERDYRSDQEIYEQRAKEVRNPVYLDKLRKAARLIEKEADQAFSGPKVTVEDSLYDGFVDKSDWALGEKFHAAESWETRAAMIPQFKDWRMRHFANRLLAMHGPEEVQTPESLSALKEQFELRLRDDAEVERSVQTIHVARRDLDEVQDDELREKCARMINAYEDQARAEIARIERRLEEWGHGEGEDTAPPQHQELDFGLFSQRP
jgi:exodeoxyribonuclease I